QVDDRGGATVDVGLVGRDDEIAAGGDRAQVDAVGDPLDPEALDQGRGLGQLADRLAVGVDGDVEDGADVGHVLDEALLRQHGDGGQVRTAVRGPDGGDLSERVDGRAPPAGTALGQLEQRDPRDEPAEAVGVDVDGHP